ncbi:GDSL esterase/lipase [Acorus calamus]|uniref:GDSL esterase/lipase n=1 Tax=Acorus calamus TaxID=4465 RepID=A0AAV9EVB6_ACOCL|nr:GDSL esterase/lipase [Acorus calamus]
MAPDVIPLCICFCFCCCWGCFFFVPASAGSRFPAIIVFGDSSVDAGNNNFVDTVLRSDFAPYGRDFKGGEATGRFCNGRLATDFISEAVGLRPTVPAYLDPAHGIEDFAIGVCFASAGTGYDNATSDVLGSIPMWKELEFFKEYRRQLQTYMGRRRAALTLRYALYIISIGTNDFLENYYLLPVRSSTYTIEEYQDFLIRLAEWFIVDIYRLGARRIALTALMPMGCLPLERTVSALTGGGCSEEYNKVAAQFNAKQMALVEKLNVMLPGLRLIYSDVHRVYTEVMRRPASFGMENVENGCCATGLFEMGYTCNRWNPFTCPDADKYLFWDAFHPTEKMNKITSDSFVKYTLPKFFVKHV